MPDHIIIFTDPLLVPLVADTALARRTSIRRDGETWTVTRAPRLSSGEEILWDILAHLARRDPIPESLSERAYARLDDDNRRVVVDVLIELAEVAA